MPRSIRGGTSILRLILLLVLLIAGALAYVPAANLRPETAPPAAPASSLTTISPLDKPTYVVGGDYNYPPYEYLENGQARGFDIDLIRAVADVMGFNVVIRLGPWSQVRQELENGQIDIISGMFYSPQRDQLVDFSTPHTLVSSGLFVRVDSPIRSFEDISGKEVIVVQGDILHDLLLSESTPVTIIPVGDSAQALRMLAAGKHDCVLLSSKIQGMFFISRFNLTNLKVLETGLPPGEYAFGVVEGNDQLRSQLNEGLNILKNDGRYKQIYDQWFGVYEKPWLERWLNYIGVAGALLLLLLAASALWTRSLHSQVKKQTEELRKSEEKFFKAFQTSPDAININRLEDGLYIDCNQGFTALTGYTRSDVVGRTSLEIDIWADPADRARLVEGLKQHGEINNLEARFRLKDGSIKTGLMSARLIEVNHERCILSITRDITELKQAMSQVESLARFPAESPNPILRLTDDGTVQYYNPSSLPLIRKWGSEQNLQAPQVWQNRIQHALKNGHKQEYEEEVEGATYTLTLAPIPKAGYVNVYGSDISEQKKAHQQIQRHLQQLEALRMVDLAITTSFDLPKTLTILLQQVKEHLGTDAVDVLVLNPNNKRLEHAASIGFLTEFVQRSSVVLGQGYAGRSALEKRPVHVNRETLRKDRIFKPHEIEGENIHEYLCIPLISKGQVRGVLEVFQRSPLNPTPEWLNFLEAMTGQAAIAIDNATLFHDLQKANAELISAYDATIEGWALALELRDGETQGHSRRVMEATMALARIIGVDQEDLDAIRRGALLHDIGKMGIPDSILLKPGPLNEEEWRVMRRHPEYAYQLLSNVEFLQPALDIPYCHHERWDGNGYPRRLKGTEIPLAARIFTVVDVWDALRSDRPYRRAWSEAAVRQYLQEQAGRQFDPEIAAIFLKHF